MGRRRQRHPHLAAVRTARTGRGDDPRVLHQFGGGALVEHGWSLSTTGRWQILVHEDATGAVPSYGAIATLLGPIREDDAGSIVERLREYAASLQPHQHETQTRVDVHFALHAGSRREAVMRALSLSDDLGYRLMHLDVFRLGAPESDCPPR